MNQTLKYEHDWDFHNSDESDPVPVDSPKVEWTPEVESLWSMNPIKTQFDSEIESNSYSSSLKKAINLPSLNS